MCGFIGKISNSNINNTLLEKANTNLICRGPDCTKQLTTSVNNLNISLILILAGPFTIFPLFFFAYAAKRLRLTTIGMMQFLSPTMQFVIAFIYGERLTSAGIICFICIWLAIMLFIYDALKQDNMNEY